MILRTAVPLVRVTMVWPGPARHLADGVSFYVQYETCGVVDVVLLSPAELAEHRVLDAYTMGYLVPRPSSQRLAGSGASSAA